MNNEYEQYLSEARGRMRREIFSDIIANFSRTPPEFGYSEMKCLNLDKYMWWYGVQTTLAIYYFNINLIKANFDKYVKKRNILYEDFDIVKTMFPTRTIEIRVEVNSDDGYNSRFIFSFEGYNITKIVYVRSLYLVYGSVTILPDESETKLLTELYNLFIFQI